LLELLHGELPEEHHLLALFRRQHAHLLRGHRHHPSTFCRSVASALRLCLSSRSPLTAHRSPLAPHRTPLAAHHSPLATRRSLNPPVYTQDAICLTNLRQAPRRSRGKLNQPHPPFWYGVVIASMYGYQGCQWTFSLSHQSCPDRRSKTTWALATPNPLGWPRREDCLHAPRPQPYRYSNSPLSPICP
jgi:hypothetical protein